MRMRFLLVPNKTVTMRWKIDFDEVNLSERTHRRKKEAVKKILLDQNDLVKADVVVDLVKSDLSGMNITANKQCKKMSKLSPYHIKQISKSIKDVLSIFPSPGNLLQDVLLDTIFSDVTLSGVLLYSGILLS